MIRVYKHYISSTYLFLLMVEYFIFLLAFNIGYKIRFLQIESWYTQNAIIQASFLFATVTCISCSMLGLYRRNLSWEDYKLIRRMIFGFILAVMIAVFIYYIFPKYHVSRSVLAYAFLFAFFGMLISRMIFYRLVNKDVLKRRILVIGGGNIAAFLSALNNTYIHKGFEIVGFYVLPGEKVVFDKIPVIQANRKLPEVCNEMNIDGIVIALDDKRLIMPVEDLLDCKMMGITILDVIGFYEQEKGIISLKELYPSWLVYSDGFAKGGFKAVKKRVFDITASLLLLSVSWPIMAITILAIILETGIHAPILYRQIRVGENNKLFEVLKFRSMHTNAEINGPQWAAEKDSRVTYVGSIIRKYRIDELPQIFNVLKGDMSFVGPRPERPEFVTKLEKSIPYYRERHRVKPGITGWAQLSYPYGANEYDAIQKLQYDLYYVKNYSLFLDISIMFNTIEVILWGKGAR